MEHIGIITKAGEELSQTGKEVFKVAIRDGDKDFTYSLFTAPLIAKAKELKGKRGKITATKPEGGKYWDVDSIEPAPEAGPTPPAKGGWQPRSPEERSSIERQVCLKCACEIAPPGQAVTDILANARKMLDWIQTP
jgi:hypothetical protein